MKDRESLYPGRVQLTPVPGQPNLFDLVRADQPTEPGTMLNTANLFRDTTALSLGLTAEAVPDDALQILKALNIGTELTSLAPLDANEAGGTWLPLDGRTITAAAYPALVELAQNYYPRVLSQAAISQTFTVQPRWTARFAWFYGRDDGMVYQINKEGSVFRVRRNNTIIGEFAHNFDETLSVIFETKTCLFAWMWNATNGYIYRATDKVNPTWEQVGVPNQIGASSVAQPLVDYEGDAIIMPGQVSGGSRVSRVARSGLSNIAVSGLTGEPHHISSIGGRLFLLRYTTSVNFLSGEILTNAAGEITSFTASPANLPTILKTALKPWKVVRCANGRYVAIPGYGGQTCVFESDGETLANIFQGRIPQQSNLFWSAFAWGNTVVLMESGAITMIGQDGTTSSITYPVGQSQQPASGLGSYAANADGLYEADHIVISGVYSSTQYVSKTTARDDAIRLPAKVSGFVRAL